MNFSLQKPKAPATGAAGSPPGPASAGDRSWELPGLGARTGTAASVRPRASGSLLRKVVVIGGVLAVVAAVAVILGVPGAGQSLSRLLASSSSGEIITYTIRPEQLDIVIREKGNLESSNNEDVTCEVEGGTTIISIVPDGSNVKKGQLVCELDSSQLRDTLAQQVISTKQAEASHQNSVLTKQVAETAVNEYINGVFIQNRQNAESQVVLAEMEQARAAERLEWAERLFKRGFYTEVQLRSEKLSVQRANIQHQEAKTALDVLLRFTKDKQVKELQSEVEKATSDALSKEAILKQETNKQAKLERQIDKCKLYAPSDGMVVYANDADRMRMGSQQIVEEGAMVRERQKIFSLPDITHMRVNTKIHESMVDRVDKGLPAKIRVEAFPNQELDGKVESVAPMPDTGNFFSSDVKVYTSYISIEKPIAGLRPGLTAQVEVLIKSYKDVLAVPFQAVLTFKGQEHVFVLGPNGPELRDVKIGASNDSKIQIAEGLKAGEKVVVNPRELLTEEQKREYFNSSAAAKDGADAKDWGPDAPQGGPDDAKKAPIPGAGPAGPGAGPDAKGGEGEKAKSKRGAGGGGFGDPAFQEKLKNATPEERQKLIEEARKKGGGRRGGMPKMDPALMEKFQNASPEEKKAMFEQFKAQNPGMFGGGGPGGGFGGPPGGGFGGGAGGPGQ